MGVTFFRSTLNFNDMMWIVEYLYEIEKPMLRAKNHVWCIQERFQEM